MDTETITSQLTELDWDYKPPCEHSQHDVLHPTEPARYFIQVDGCCRTARYLICEPGYCLLVRDEFLRCPHCGTLNQWPNITVLMDLEES